jgi:signal transduction histidine kinase
VDEDSPSPRAALPGRRWVRWTAVVVVWTVVGLFYATRPYLNALAYQRPFPTSSVIPANLLDAYVWAIFTPFIVWLTRRFPLNAARWRSSLLVHLAAGLALATLDAGVNVLAAPLFFHEARPAFGMYLAVTVHWNLQWYWMVIGVRYALDYYRKYRDRELRASQLETQLARAQLHALKMQIQPHFLFNALNTISELVYTDPAGTEEMIAGLGRLIRERLEQSDRQESTLAHEIEFLELYTAIEQVRFRGWLAFEFDVPPDTRDVLVPSLLLQPLVENAIRHGIAPLHGPGTVRISARRGGGRLSIRVTDDGVGLPEGGPETIRPGIGIRNARERLQQLHGDAAELHLERREPRGTSVHLSLPLRRDAAGAAAREGEGDDAVRPATEGVMG